MNEDDYAAELRHYIRHLQRKLKAIELNKGPSPPPEPISDHAIVRYLERVKGIDMRRLRAEILPHERRALLASYQQTQRWLEAGCFEALVDDLRVVLRLAAGRAPEPSAAILDSRTLRSSPESGERAGYDGAKRKKGSKLHLAVDTLGHLLALHVTPANAEDRSEVGRLAEAVQEATGQSVDLAYVDQDYTGERAEKAAKDHEVTLEVVKLPEAKKGFVLLPRRWVVERSFAWATRFRRLVKDYERYASTLADLHIVAFVCLMLKNVARLTIGQ